MIVKLCHRIETEFSNLYRIYILDQATAMDDCFCLVVLDFYKKAIYYLDPRCDNTAYPPPARATLIHTLINRFLAHHIEEDSELLTSTWVLHRTLESPKFPYLQNDFDSGIYVFMFFYYAVFECPIVFDDSDPARMRRQLAFWLLKEYLPL